MMIRKLLLAALVFVGLAAFSGGAAAAPCPGAVYYVDPTNGSDANDGCNPSASATPSPFRTLSWAVQNATARTLGGFAIDGQGFTFQETVRVYYPLGVGGTVQFQNFTWRPANGGIALQFGDGALVGVTNIAFNTVGVSGPQSYIAGHNHGVLDVNSGVSFTTGGVADLFNCDFDTHFNINNGLTIYNSGGGSSGFIARGCPHSTWDFNGPFQFVGTPVFGRFAWARGADMTFEGNVSFNGAINISPALVNQLGHILNMTGQTLPGGNPIVSTGGQYNTGLAQ